MAMALAAVLYAAVLSIVGASRLLSFDAFIQQYGRIYMQGSAEYRKRSQRYAEVRAAAELHNRNADRLWSAGVNHLWDWTPAELTRLRGWDGSRKPPESSSTRSIYSHGTFLHQQSPVPTEKIWTNLATNRRIRDQRGCGSCWAISTATVLEAHCELYTGSRRTFSPQQIVECTPNPRHCGGDGGCKGATAELAMEWVLRHGCAKESHVPYTGTDGTCTVSSPGLQLSQLLNNATSASESEVANLVPDVASSFGMTGWETLPKNKYEPLLRTIADKGPVVVSVDASSFHMYQSGIFNGCAKDAIIDHAVTAMGYGVENGVKFWLIQNSWGEDWGENGHIRLFRHDGDDFCGMNAKPELGVACKGETQPVPVCGMCGILFDSVVPHFQKPYNA